MPLDLTIDSDHRILMMRGSGVLTDSDLAGAQSELESVDQEKRAFTRICDLSKVTDVSVSNESLNGWVADPNSNPTVRHAIICDAAPVLKRVLDFVALTRKQYR